MSSPRHDRWRVQGFKPDDIQRFDSLVDQPLQCAQQSRRGGGPSDVVYEIFTTEAEASRFALYISLLGATNVSIRPPQTS